MPIHGRVYDWEYWKLKSDQNCFRFPWIKTDVFLISQTVNICGTAVSHTRPVFLKSGQCFKGAMAWENNSSAISLATVKTQAELVVDHCWKGVCLVCIQLNFFVYLLSPQNILLQTREGQNYCVYCVEIVQGTRSSCEHHLYYIPPVLIIFFHLRPSYDLI